MAYHSGDVVYDYYAAALRGDNDQIDSMGGYAAPLLYTGSGGGSETDWGNVLGLAGSFAANPLGTVFGMFLNGFSNRRKRDKERKRRREYLAQFIPLIDYLGSLANSGKITMQQYHNYVGLINRGVFGTSRSALIRAINGGMLMDDGSMNPNGGNGYGGEEGMDMGGYEENLDMIGGFEGMNGVDRGYLDQQRSAIQNYIDGIRSGEVSAEVLSPEIRQTMIDQAESNFGRILEGSMEGSLAELSRRGLLPSDGSAGFSGPGAQVLADRRALLYEDPLTSFISDMDIQNEMQRLARQQQLNDIATNLQQRLLTSGENIYSTGLQYNLGLQDVAAGLYGENLRNQQFYDNLQSKLDMMNLEYRLRGDLQESAWDREDDQSVWEVLPEIISTGWDIYQKTENPGGGDTTDWSSVLSGGGSTGLGSYNYSTPSWSDYANTNTTSILGDLGSGYSTGTSYNYNPLGGYYTW